MNNAIPLILVLIISFVIASSLDKRSRRKRDPELKRRDDLAALADKLGLEFKSDCSFKLADQFSFLSWLRRGEARCASHVFRGIYLDHPVIIFDYFFSLSGKGNNCYWSAYILEMDANFPDTIISHETVANRLLETLGASHISLESADFSRSFNVRSTDRKFAFDVYNAEMMKYLTANRDLIVEINQAAVLLVFEDWLRPEKVESNLSRLVQVRKLLPQYLFSNK